MGKCFIFIARLCGLGSIKPIPAWVLGRNSVFLEMGSLFENCQMYLKMFEYICFKMYGGIGKILLEKVIFKSTRVFKIIAFPDRGSSLLKS